MKVVGTLRAYKQEKQFSGGKVFEATDNTVFCHYYEIINAWMYLTGELESLKENNLKSVNDSARNIALGGGMNYSNNYYSNNGYGSGMKENNSNYKIRNSEDAAYEVLGDLRSRNNNAIKRNELYQLIKTKFQHYRINDNINEALNNLINTGYLLDEGDGLYKVMY